MEKWIAVLAVLLQITSPTTQNNLHGCMTENISDLQSWLCINYEPTNTLKLSGSFVELSTEIDIRDYPDQIRTVDLSGNRLKYLKRFHFTLDHLVVLELSANEIENLNSSSIFKDQPSLKYINLSYNRISSIHSEAFSGLQKLEQLILSDNQLTEIGNAVFAPLIQMKHLQLDTNKIEKIQSGSFSHLNNLRHLILHNNELLEFDSSILPTNVMLYDVSLGNSSRGLLSLTGNINSFRAKLFKIGPSNFTANVKFMSLANSRMPILILDKKVETIIANNCSITKFINDNVMETSVDHFSENTVTGALSFVNFNSLVDVDLSYNRIESVSFVNCTKVTYLNLSHNNLTYIHDTTIPPSTKVLILSFNCITNVELDTFSHLSLKVLSLRNTCLKSFDYRTFDFNLRTLDISFNNLQSIDLKKLSVHANLENLYIDGNNLTDAKPFDSVEIYFPKLQSIGLTHNAWTCKCLITMIQKFAQLDVRLIVEKAVYRSKNIQGIGCTSNTNITSFIVPMEMNHTMFMSQVVQLNKTVATLKDMTDLKITDGGIHFDSIKEAMDELLKIKAEMKSNLDNEISQIKEYGKIAIDKFKTLKNLNYEESMRLKNMMNEFNATNNRNYDLMSQNVERIGTTVDHLFVDDDINVKYKAPIASRDGNINSLQTLELIIMFSVFVLIIIAFCFILMYHP
ncbi:Slit like 2 protein [Pseudolycoriella hygida]|uniref:Slit like 2 protein n=1 Tax=Pseudolycoriella hygida TaxID=35572 RepID=A0A9Q0MM44_9DIPT|nr:Slit like 2 protein [Pseudolycoriella hygida]